MLKSFLSDGLSIDETKVSAFVICLVACVISACYMVIGGHEIPDSLRKLIEWLIGGITTVNVSKHLTDKSKESDDKCQPGKTSNQ